MADLQRLNTNIPREVYDWIASESSRTGVTKSALIYMVFKTYMDQQKTLELTDYVRRLEAQKLIMEQDKHNDQTL